MADLDNVTLSIMKIFGPCEKCEDPFSFNQTDGVCIRCDRPESDDKTNFKSHEMDKLEPVTLPNGDIGYFVTFNYDEEEKEEEYEQRQVYSSFTFNRCDKPWCNVPR